MLRTYSMFAHYLSCTLAWITHMLHVYILNSFCFHLFHNGENIVGHSSKLKCFVVKVGSVDRSCGFCIFALQIRTLKIWKGPGQYPQLLSPLDSVKDGLRLMHRDRLQRLVQWLWRKSRCPFSKKVQAKHFTLKTEKTTAVESTEAWAVLHLITFFYFLLTNNVFWRKNLMTEWVEWA